MKSRDVLLALGLLATVYVWGECRARTAAKQALQVQQDRVDDSTRAATDRWKAQFVAREVARESTLAQSGRTVEAQRREIARLRAYVRTDITDSTPRDSLVLAVAQRDVLIDSLEAFTVTLDAARTADARIYRAMIADRDSLIQRREVETAALLRARETWRRAAQPGLLTKLGRGLPYLAAGVVAGIALTR